MRGMRMAMVAVALGGFMGAADAEVYCWTGKDGGRQCGDTPPPGVKATAMRPPSSAASAPGAAEKGARKGPLTPTEQEQAFRKRQIDAEKGREKEAEDLAQANTKKENCERARDAERTLQSGQRIARVDARGERAYMDDQQIAAESAKAREMVRDWCN